MKNLKLNPTLVAAVILGLTAFNNHAEAAQGMKLANLKTIATDFDVIQDGRQITFTGMIPKSCAAGAKTEFGFDNKAGESSHFIIVRLAKECEKENYTANVEEERVALSSVLNPVNLDNKSGSIALRYLGDDAKSKPKQDLLEGLTPIVSSTELAEKERADEEYQRSEREQAEYAKRVAELLNYCQNKEYVGLGDAMRDNSDMFENVTDALNDLQDLQRKDFERRLSKAKTAEEAQKIYAEYKAAAAKNRWEAEALDGKYAAARERILKASVEELKDEDSEYSMSDVAEAIDAWKEELADLDLEGNKEHKKEIAALYMDIGLIATEKKDLKNAEKYMLKAARMSNKSDSAAVKSELARINKEAYNECLEENSERIDRIERCEKKFIKKARQYDDQVLGYLKKDKSEEGSDKYEEASTDYAKFYGAGPTFNQAGFGSFTPYYMGDEGSFQNSKIEMLKNYQQNMMMQQGMMQQGGMMPQGGMMSPNYFGGRGF